MDFFGSFWIRILIAPVSSCLLACCFCCKRYLWKNDHWQPIDRTVFWFILNRPSILLCIHVLTQLVYFIFLLLERAWHDSFCVCSSSWEYVSVSTVAGASISGRRDISSQTDSSPVRKVVLRFFWRFGHFSDGISSIQYSKFHINFVKETVFHGKGICKNLISKYFSTSSQGIFQNMPGDWTWLHHQPSYLKKTRLETTKIKTGAFFFIFSY